MSLTLENSRGCERLARAVGMPISGIQQAPGVPQGSRKTRSMQVPFCDLKKCQCRWQWWHIPLFPTIGSLWQADLWVLRQPGPCRETLCQKKRKEKKGKNNVNVECSKNRMVVWNFWNIFCFCSCTMYSVIILKIWWILIHIFHWMNLLTTVFLVVRFDSVLLFEGTWKEKKNDKEKEKERKDERWKEGEVEEKERRKRKEKETKTKKICEY